MANVIWYCCVACSYRNLFSVLCPLSPEWRTFGATYFTDQVAFFVKFSCKCIFNCTCTCIDQHYIFYNYRSAVLPTLKLTTYKPFQMERSVCIGSKHRVCNQLTSSYRQTFTLIVVPLGLTNLWVCPKYFKTLDEKKFYNLLWQFYVLISYTNIITPYFKIVGATLARVECHIALLTPHM